MNYYDRNYSIRTNCYKYFSNSRSSNDCPHLGNLYMGQRIIKIEMEAIVENIKLFANNNVSRELELLRSWIVALRELNDERVDVLKQRIKELETIKK